MELSMSNFRLPMRILTLNVRFAAEPPGPGEERWARRLPLVVQNLRFHTTAIRTSLLCLQEVLHGQLVDILHSMNDKKSSDALNEGNSQPEWDYIGAGRTDGKEAGEYTPIIFRPHVWHLLEEDVRWLSPKPKRKGWDASSIRIVTIGRFSHRQSGEEVVVMNTHLDDQGVVARRESARLLQQFAEEWAGRKDGQRDIPVPIVLAGDLNSQTDGDAYQLLDAHVGNDAKECSDEYGRYGEEVTYTGFEGKGEEEERLDYIFLGPPEHCSKARDGGANRAEQQKRWQWHAREYAVLPNRFTREAVYSSDHRAVVADVELAQHHGDVGTI
ncbi:MAG: hypothetical protein M1831_006028 [Alyxoria varia]|nr:MAG: hypothetical protein M1831_006028 [Alyxoria varia]